MRKLVLRTICVCFGAVALLALAAPAIAHEERATGPVTAVVGWSNEPAYVGFPNSVSLALTDSADDPITDLGPDALQVEVTFGDQKSPPMPLEAAFGSPGEYQAEVIPTRAGVYSFRIFGTVRGQAYDETFTSGEGTFASPRNPADVSFPTKDPTAGELAASIERLSDAEDDSDGGTSPTSILAIALGGVALAFALIALAKSNKRAA
ncbi:MAG TPA: hypothetical protein VHL54_10375 [Actinomycetota bacterium]|nr:hypothetical protein [Actinomycetota bacterium]